MPREEEMAGPSGSGTASRDAASDDCHQTSGNPAISDLLDQIQAMLRTDTERLLASLNDLDDTSVSQEGVSGIPSFHASLSRVSGLRAWHLDVFWRGPSAQAALAARRSAMRTERAASIAAAWAVRQVPDKG